MVTIFKSGSPFRIEVQDIWSGRTYVAIYSGGTVGKFVEYALKDDLNNVSNKLILSGMKTLSVKWVNGNIMEFYVDNTRVFGISAKWNETYS